MEAKARQLESLFDRNVCYQVPLFQRPYVWNEEENWSFLWEDIQALLDKQLRKGAAHPHFLGAIVLEQLPHASGSIETRLVIDGQQRFTTIQTILMAARNLAKERGAKRYGTRFEGLTENDEDRIEKEHERYKLWPTNSDREPFALIHKAATLAEVESAAVASDELKANSIIGAYRYFHRQLSSWLDGKFDEDDGGEAKFTPEDRIEALWQVVKSKLQLVVIDLDKEDETQVIFETLNARGTELLPADLIKNYLFRKAAAIDEAGADKLYEKYWRGFETQFWREKVQQGRIYRPRIDIFINHYLSLMTQDEVRSAHLFNAFKAFAEEAEAVEGSLIHVPTTPAEHIAQLARYAAVFQTFYDAGKHEALALFLRRLDAVDTATVYPFLMYAHAELMPGNQAEFDRLLGVVESFLMRRLITNYTSKNYNRLFIDLIRAVDKTGAVTADAVSAYLGQGSGESTRFPSDNEVREALSTQGLYKRISQPKVRAVLEALDAASHSSKSETLAMPTNLTIEHVMPQTWQTHWPLPDSLKADPVAEQKATARRSILVHALGNLTLITGKLNPSLSNAAWSAKRPELLKFSKLNLTRYFHGGEAETWDESAIERRTEVLTTHLLKIWPAPKLVSEQRSDPAGTAKP